MIDQKDVQIKNVLSENIDALEKSLKILQHSYDICIKIDAPYSMEELDDVEAFTSRFARSTDVLTQKVIKSLIRVLREDANTFIDRANLLEKLDVVKSAKELILIRDLRNKIAHEYLMEDTTAILPDCLPLTQKLFEISKNVVEYSNTVIN